MWGGEAIWKGDCKDESVLCGRGKQIARASGMFLFQNKREGSFCVWRGVEVCYRGEGFLRIWG